jgi:hypothetical protein
MSEDNAPGICFFCDKQMFHCYECDNNFCETLDCVGNDKTHDWMKCKGDKYE